MKLADAQELLKLVKLEGPITERWWCETDEGILLEAWPLGFARGSLGISDAFTIIPHWQYSALFTGEGVPHHLKVPKMSPHHLWEQEQYVYYREMQEQMAKAIEGLWDVKERPRPKHISPNDPTPYPEDFGMPPMEAHWHCQGKCSLRKIELQLLKLDFMELLNRFITKGELNGQRTVV